MSGNAMRKLIKRTEEAQARIKRNKEIEAEYLPPEPDSESKSTRAYSGYTNDEIVARTSNKAFKGEQLGLFDSCPIAQRDAFPTLLTRIPIFMPISKAKQKKLLNEDNALLFDTPFGKGERHGANLGVFDEDVLYALAWLSNRKLIGRHESMPIKVPFTYKADKNGNVNVDAVVCTISEIREKLGISKGGTGHKNIISSLKRLTTTSLILTLNKHERYLGNCEIGKSIKLVDIEWQLYSSDGIIYAQFSPIITNWLQYEFTYYDWNTRKKLNYALAKALHRYLSSQPKEFCKFNKLVDIAASVGYYGRTRDLYSSFNKALDELVEVNFLIDYCICGTGRSVPFTLRATRA